MAEALESKLADKFNNVKQTNMDAEETEKELEDLTKMDKVNPTSQADLAAKLAQRKSPEEVARITEDHQEDNVNEEKKNALAAKLAGKMTAVKQATMDAKEQAGELEALEKRDLVNPDTQAGLAAMLGKRKTAAEVERITEDHQKDNVNEEKKTALADALAGKMTAVKQATMDAKEQAGELDALEARDLVNPDTQAGLAAMLGKRKSAAEVKRITEDHQKDNVNEAKKAALADALKGKMTAAKQDAMDARETEEELKGIEELDAVNDASKAKLEGLLANVKKPATS